MDQVPLLLQVLEPIFRLKIELPCCFAHLRLEHSVLHLLLGIHRFGRSHLLISWLRALNSARIPIGVVPRLHFSYEIRALLFTLGQLGLSQRLQLDRSLDGPVQIVQDLDQDLQGLPSQRGHLLVREQTVVVAFLELALGNAGERVNDADTDVLLADVAIVVCKDFEDVLRVLAETVEEIEDTVLAVVLRVSGVEHSEEEVVDKDAYRLLEVLSEMEEEQMEDRNSP